MTERERLIENNKENKMKRFTVILKNGRDIVFDALEVEVSYNTATGKLEKLSWVGAHGNMPLYILPSKIAAIYYEKLPEDGEGK